MRGLLIAVVMFCGALAQAEVVKCDGHELTVGDTGATGTVIVDVTAMTATWQPAGAATAEQEVGKNSLCGVNLSGSICQAYNESMASAPGVGILCATASGAATGQGGLVYSENSMNGRVSCRLVGSTLVSRTVEFNNCVVQ